MTSDTAPAKRPWINESNSSKVIVLPQPQQHVVPSSDEAERAVLGAVIANPNVLAALDFLRAEDFYLLRHTYIWRAIELLEADPQIGMDGIDYLTVTEKLRTTLVNGTPALDMIGGPATITEIMLATPQYSHAVIYGRLVQRAAIRRRLMQAASNVYALARDENLTLDDVVDRANQELFAATDQALDEEDSSLAAGVDAYMQAFVHDMANGQQSALPSGIPVFDTTFRGFFRREITMLMGQPGTGKTSWMLTVAMNQAKLGLRVAIFSQEMTRSQLIERLIAMETGIHGLKIKGRQLTMSEAGKVQAAASRIRDLPIEIITDIPRLTPMAFKRRLRKLKHQKGVEMACIDGLWRMYHDDPNVPDDDRRYKPIMLALAEIMKNDEATNMPLLLVHQYNAGGNAKRRPTQANVGGNAVQDAQSIFSLWRESDHDTATDLIPLKHRDGVFTEISLGYQRENMRYIDPNVPVQAKTPPPIWAQDGNDARQLSEMTDEERRMAAVTF